MSQARGMRDLIVKWTEEFKDDTLGVLYFSGHGVVACDKVDDRQQLHVTGINSKLSDGSGTLAFDDIESILCDYHKRDRVRAVAIVDCCRAECAFAVPQLPPSDGGVKGADDPTHVSIMYACMDGKKAREGAKLSKFTAALLPWLQTPGMNLATAFSHAAETLDKEQRKEGIEPCDLKYQVPQLLGTGAMGLIVLVPAGEGIATSTAGSGIATSMSASAGAPTSSGGASAASASAHGPAPSAPGVTREGSVAGVCETKGTDAAAVVDDTCDDADGDVTVEYGCGTASTAAVTVSASAVPAVRGAPTQVERDVRDILQRLTADVGHMSQTVDAIAENAGVARSATYTSVVSSTMGQGNSLGK